MSYSLLPKQADDVLRSEALENGAVQRGVRERFRVSLGARTSTSPRSGPARMDASRDTVQSAYIRQLTRACPVLEDQLADIYQVLLAVSEADNAREDSPLDSARAAYIADLRQRHLAFTQLVAEVAAVCACVFLQECAPPPAPASFNQ